MANIKFSAFTQKVAQADVDFLVGYTGADNVRITPAALGDGIYLPLGGGTMVGDVIYNDNIRIKLGTGGGNSDIYHNGTDMSIRNLTTAGDMNFSADSTGSGGAATSYFWLDGGVVKTRVAKDMNFEDNVKATFGNVATPDLQIQHDSTDSLVDNYTGHLYIRQQADDKDIIFQSDDGSGGIETYFYLDGSANRNVSNKNFRIIDNKKLTLGSSDDLEIYHDGSNSYIQDTGTGELRLLSSGTSIMSAAGSEYIAYFAGTGAQNASLYAGNAKKLETTATGIEVTDEVSIGTSLVHTGDTDTKVSFGTDEIVLTTAGTDRMLVAPTGEVAVGGTNIAYKFNVHEGDMFVGATVAAGGRGIYFQRTGAANNWSLLQGHNGTNAFELREGSDTRMFWENGGDVGIGTVTPSYNLDIDDAGGSVLQLNDSAGRYLRLRSANSGAQSVNISSYSGLHLGGTDNSNDLTVASTGNVGIGTVTPTAALQVVGLVEYADNAAALLAGLTAGAFYRTGDLLKVVH